LHLRGFILELDRDSHQQFPLEFQQRPYYQVPGAFKALVENVSRIDLQFKEDNKYELSKDQFENMINQKDDLITQMN